MPQGRIHGKRSEGTAFYSNYRHPAQQTLEMRSEDLALNEVFSKVCRELFGDGKCRGLNYR
jgi:hypothetical protein